MGLKGKFKFLVLFAHLFLLGGLLALADKVILRKDIKLVALFSAWLIIILWFGAYIKKQKNKK